MVAASYRFAPACPFQAAVEDAKDLLYHLLHVAPSRWGVDADRIAASGSSAGGGLALGLGLLPEVSLTTYIKTCATSYGATVTRTHRLQFPEAETQRYAPV